MASGLPPLPSPSVFMRGRGADLLNVAGRPTATVLMFAAFEIDGEPGVHSLVIDLEVVSVCFLHDKRSESVTLSMVVGIVGVNGGRQGRGAFGG